MERVLLTAPSFNSVNSELSYLSSDIVNDLTYLVRVFNFVKRKKLEQSYCKKKCIMYSLESLSHVLHSEITC